MFKLALVLGAIALVAAIFGFGGLAGTLVDVAVVIFFIALALTAIFLILGWTAARKVMR